MDAVIARRARVAVASVLVATALTACSPTRVVEFWDASVRVELGDVVQVEYAAVDEERVVADVAARGTAVEVETSYGVLTVAVSAPDDEIGPSVVNPSGDPRQLPGGTEVRTVTWSLEASEPPFGPWSVWLTSGVATAAVDGTPCCRPDHSGVFEVVVLADQPLAVRVEHDGESHVVEVPDDPGTMPG